MLEKTFNILDKMENLPSPRTPTRGRLPVPEKRVRGKNFTKEQETYLKGKFNVFLQLLALNIERFGVRPKERFLDPPPPINFYKHIYG